MMGSLGPDRGLCSGVNEGDVWCAADLCVDVSLWECNVAFPVAVVSCSSVGYGSEAFVYCVMLESVNVVSIALISVCKLLGM